MDSETGLELCSGTSTRVVGEHFLFISADNLHKQCSGPSGHISDQEESDSWLWSSHFHGEDR